MFLATWYPDYMNCSSSPIQTTPPDQYWRKN